MEILFGDKVLAQDGKEVGAVSRVIVDADTREVTHVIIGKGGSATQDRLLPLSMVQGKTEQGLLLHATERQVDQFPTFAGAALATPGVETGELRSTTTELSGKPAEGERPGAAAPETRAMALRHVSVALGEACPVEAIEDELGPLAGVRLDVYTNKISSIVVASGKRLKQSAAVPATWISDISSQRIKLALSAEQAASLVGPGAGPYLSTEGEDERGGGGAK